jgi:hypothetical protein
MKINSEDINMKVEILRREFSDDDIVTIELDIEGGSTGNFHIRRNGKDYKPNDYECHSYYVDEDMLEQFYKVKPLKKNKSTKN